MIEYLFYGRVTAIMKTTNASAIGTFFNLQADDLDEMDWQWDGNETLAHAVYFSRSILHSVTEPNVFNVSSPHTTFHSTARCSRANCKTTPWIGLPKKLIGFSTASLSGP